MKTVKRKFLYFVFIITIFIISVPMFVFANAYEEAFNLPDLSGNQKEDVIAVAKSQCGYTENNDESIYGGPTLEWSACFVEWCFKNANSKELLPNSFNGIVSPADFGFDSQQIREFVTDGDIQVGDIFFVHTYGSLVTYNRCGIVVSVDDSYIYTVEGDVGNPGKVAELKYYRDSGIDSEYSGYIIEYVRPLYGIVPLTVHNVNSVYGVDFAAYPKNKQENTPVYNSDHSVASGKYIAPGTKCTVNEVYTDGCCKVTYSNSENIEVFYAHMTDFVFTSPDSKPPKLSLLVSEKGAGYVYDNAPAIVSGIVKAPYCFRYKLTDGNTGELYNSSNTSYYSVTVTVYNPDGTVLSSYTFYNSDDDYFTAEPKQCGTYIINCKTEGVFAEEINSMFTVESTGKIVADCNSIMLDVQNKKTGKFNIVTSGALPDNFRTEISLSGDCITAETNKDGSVTVNAVKSGVSSVTVNVCDPVSGLILSSATVNVSVTSPIYTITFNPSGGTSAPDSAEKVYNEPLILSSDKPERTGYTFMGWATQDDLSLVKYAPGGLYTENRSQTLYALWKENEYSVKYDANGGKNSPPEQTKLFGTELTLSLSEPIKTETVFLGWSSSKIADTVEYKPGDKYVNNGNIVLYAVWCNHAKCSEAELTAPSCTSEGEKSVVCTVCGYTYTKAIPKTEHVYNCTVTNPSCTSNGVKNYTCSCCGKTYNESIPKIGHSCDSVTVAPTCTLKGWTSHTCSICGYSYETDKTEPLGHNYVIEITKKPSCTVSGEKICTCQRCKEVFTESIKATGHDFGEWFTVVPPTEEKTGNEQRQCKVCGKTESRTTPILLPDNTEIVSSDSLETTTGKTEFLLGDVNGDGIVTAADARLALRISANLENAANSQLLAADVDKNDYVTASDARKILRFSAGLGKF